MNASPTAATETPPDPAKTQPIVTPPPLEPEEKPIIVRDHGVESDEEHDIDKAAGDEGIDDEVEDGVDEEVEDDDADGK